MLPDDESRESPGVRLPCSLLMLISGSRVGDLILDPEAMSSTFFLIAACFSRLHSYSPSRSHSSGSLIELSSQFKDILSCRNIKQQTWVSRGWGQSRRAPLRPSASHSEAEAGAGG